MTASLVWSARRNEPGLVTVQHMLRDALERAERDGFGRALVLFLDKEGERYQSGYQQAGMTLSECVALMEVCKARMMQELAGGG